MNEQSVNEIAGFLLVNKPAGITSYRCVDALKSILGKKARIGHAGTLDCFATGLLIIGISRSVTKHIDEVMRLDKIYKATGKLGQLTDTLDKSGAVLKDEIISTITQKQLEDAIQSFGDRYEQIPPIFSALKHQGQRLSDCARFGKTIEELAAIVDHKKREIFLYRLEVSDWNLPFFSIEAHVSHGTYIRSLVDDIAKRVGTHATTHVLERSSIGPFNLDAAHPISSFNVLEDIRSRLIPAEVMFAQIAAWKV